MKKMYLTPELHVNEAQVLNMMAVSLQDGNADPDKPVLTKESDDWDLWDDEAEQSRSSLNMFPHCLLNGERWGNVYQV